MTEIFTAAKMNKAVHKLRDDIKEAVKATTGTPEERNKYYEYIEKEAAQRFRALYDEDRHFELMSKNSVLIMFRLNQRHRFIPFHQFGIYIDID